jgi:hypothetical protein
LSGTGSIAGWKEPPSGVVALAIEKQGGLAAVELQAADLVFAVIDVWSRLWPPTIGTA